MTLEAEYSKQIELGQWIAANYKVELHVENEKQLYALTCFDLVIEHHTAICVLQNQGLYGSTLSMVRIIYEALVKGMFLLHCATDEEIKAYEAGDFNRPNFGDQIIRIEQATSSVESGLSKLKKSSWKTFNCFTHSGISHVSRRNKDGETGAFNYPESEISQALSLAGTFALLAVTQLALLAHQPKLIELALDRMREYVA
jgi:hypothetical protein